MVIFECGHSLFCGTKVNVVMPVEDDPRLNVTFQARSLTSWIQMSFGGVTTRQSTAEVKPKYVYLSINVS